MARASRFAGRIVSFGEADGASVRATEVEISASAGCAHESSRRWRAAD
jgi:hypothetical protein